MNIQLKKFIDVSDWDDFVRTTYGRPYSLQQQDSCKERGLIHLDVPSEFEEDGYSMDGIPEIVNDPIMCVKFDKWLDRDPKQPLENQKYDWQLLMWWERNFYPALEVVANDLHKKGLLEAGEYVIEIDW